MKRNLALSIALGLLVFGGSAAYSQQDMSQNWNRTVSAPDSSFLSEVSQANAAEVQAGQLALERSHNVNVQRLARMIIEDHNMAQESVRAFNAGNMAWPSTPSTEQSESYSKLEGLSGDSFDHAFIKDQIEAHKKAIWMFQRQLQESTDPQVKTFARGTLPTLQRHLMELKYLKAKCYIWSPWN